MRRGQWLTLIGLLTVTLAIIAGGSAPDASSKITVKVYSVADLVAPIRVSPDEPARTSLSGWSTGLQSESAQRLDRLQSVLRLALPDDQWEVGEGPGAIAGYAEKLSLVIRQTEAGHQAIEELLRQIRAEDEVEIELAIECCGATAEGGEIDDLALLEVLNRPLSTDELPKLRNRMQGRKIGTTIRVSNGQTAVPGNFMVIGTLRITAVAAADRKSVTLRLDNITDDPRPDGTMPWTSQSTRIPVGTSAGMLIGCDGSNLIYLVTPRLVERKQP